MALGGGGEAERVGARRGLIIKGGEFIESLAKIKYIIFDKTGIVCDKNKIKIKNSVLYLDISPAAKNKPSTEMPLLAGTALG